MRAKYIIRLDDACENMNFENWLHVIKILNTYAVKPIIGIVPKNEDKSLEFNDKWSSERYWNLMRHLQEIGWIIAMHGYRHVIKYTTEKLLLSNVDRCEFADESEETVCQQIKAGYDLLLSHKIYPKIYMAPAHGIRLKTLLAIKRVTPIKWITDGFSIRPYRYYGFIWLPQQLWNYRNLPLGIWTICYHPSTMTKSDLIFFEDSIRKITERGQLYNLDLSKSLCREFGLYDRLISKLIKWRISRRG